MKAETAHVFTGRWITDGEFAALAPRNVFHKQLQPVDLPCDEHRDRHILFRRRFTLERAPEKALLFITADDYYKVYINGLFVGQGPAPAYHFQYGYNTFDVSSFLRAGENVIAVHTLYQGLINRVWVSGDQRHGLICDLEADGQTVLASDEAFLTHPHTAYHETGTAGYKTQFLERYDSAAPEVGFERPDFDDSLWLPAQARQILDYTLVPQPTETLRFESLSPVRIERRGNVMRLDFGACRVGYLTACAQGRAGDEIIVRCAQELSDDGSLRWRLRANCDYEETWRLSGKRDALDWFDYKTFRYAELTLPEGCAVTNVALRARHYPFALKAAMNPDAAGDEGLRAIWELCVSSQKYGVQEVIQDCMEREKGFYVGDGCYTALANLVLTRDDAIVRKLIDDAFASTFITEGMVTCLDCAFMQEIAEYPLMLISLILWHFRLCGDQDYLAQNYPKICRLLDVYRADYEKDFLLRDLDKWCVVEWPANFRDGYDVDITEGRVCHTPHVAINAYYLEAIHCANQIAALLGQSAYRDEAPLRARFTAAFYDETRHIFRDSTETRHASFIGNALAYGFRLYPDETCAETIEAWTDRVGITAVGLFGVWPLLCGLVRRGKRERVLSLIGEDGAWKRMLREGATSTFEGWGKDTKWNTSLFHLTMTDAAVFLADIDLETLFG